MWENARELRSSVRLHTKSVTPKAGRKNPDRDEYEELTETHESRFTFHKVSDSHIDIGPKREYWHNPAKVDQ